MKSLFFILSFFFVYSCSVAQRSYSSKSKKAISLFEEGLNTPNQTIDPQTGGPNFPEGIELMEKAKAKDPLFWEAYLVAGEFYETVRNYPKAIENFKEAIRINPNHASTGSTYYYVAKLSQLEGNYKDAIKYVDEFLLFKSANPELKKDAIQIKYNSAFAIDAMANPVKFEPINVGPGINTSQPEYFPTITVDGKTILFTRRIKDSRVQGSYREQEDFYVSQLDNNNSWGKALAMPPNVNTVNNEGAPTLSPDGRSLIFVACPDASGENYGEGRYGKGSCDLFYTKRLGNQWSNPENLKGLVNSFHWETQPSLSSDGKTLYFIRGVYTREGERLSDIYTSTLLDNGTWSKAERLSDIINTPYSEESVLIHPDGNTLYFASKGHQGLGGSDLFMSRKDALGNWTKPVNLGYPINTENNENSLMVSADGEIAFFASDRAGGFGDLDIYYFELPKHLRPTKTLYFEGVVFDIESNDPVSGKFQLIDIETGKEIITSYSDGSNGEFLVSLPLNKKYVLNVSHPDYAFYSNSFDLKNPDGAESVRMNIPLIPLSSALPTVLNNVFFDLGKSTLRTESFIELNKLKEFLNDNPKLKIEISGHTDTRGDAKENLTLSSDRAKEVMNYLIAQGIPASRLISKGYGETQPVVSDKEIDAISETVLKEAAHQKNRRTEYKILQN
jgi:outer membrane protein OmpA-like peptidoglycan-associated protein/tetratricopeptide (TPR) repeat protein